MLEYLPMLTDAILLGICLLLGRRAREQQEDIDNLKATDEYLEGRVGTVVDLYAEQRQEAERMEKRWFEGVSNIMNYDLNQARRGAGHENED